MLIVITGGSGSGKSAYAESRLTSLPEKEKIYLATMQPFGEEGKRRIQRHLKLREGKGFRTIEKYTDIGEADVPEGAAVLLECMSNLAANEVFSEGGAGDDTVEAVLSGIQRILERVSDLIIVTNEIFSDAFSYDKETIKYMRILGEINQRLAAMASEVYEVVYGIPVILKGERHEKALEQL